MLPSDIRRKRDYINEVNCTLSRSSATTMTIYDDYTEYTAKYRAKYGELALVLIEVGSFWELYDCDEHRGADMRAIGELLNIQVSRKNKTIVQVSASNPEMAGFPSHALAKFMPILLESGYTVILVGQVTPPPNPKRAVTQILSQGTCIDYVKNSDSNVVCSLHVEIVDSVFVCGVGFVDVTTGETWVQEVGGTQNDNKLALNQVFALLQAFRPCEMVLSGRLDANEQKLFRSHLDFSSARVFDYMNVCYSSYPQLEKVAFQNAVLKKSFPNTGILTPLEYCGLERTSFAAVAFVHLLLYIGAHNEQLVELLKCPKSLENAGHMEISYNAAHQLELDLVLKYLNRCGTPMGRRAFKQRFTLPKTCIKQLNDSYDLIQQQISFGIKALDEKHTWLKKIHDIPRLFRRCQMHQLNPCEWVNVLRSIDAFHNLSPEHTASCNIRAKLDATLNMYVCERTNLDTITGNLFVHGAIPCADELQKRIDSILSEFESFQSLPDNNGTFKLESNDRDGYFFTCTNKRFKQFTGTLKWCICDGLVVEINSSMQHVVQPAGHVKIMHPNLTKASNELVKAQKEMHEMMTREYMRFLDTFIVDHLLDVNSLIDDITSLDWAVTNARNAIEYGYTRPLLLTALGAQSNSQLKATALRHPAVERMDLATAFVPNDVTLNGNGMLLYGLNAAGKSTLMKAVGLAVIMAQCGTFVPCAELQFTPFDHVFTRIHRGDDIRRGQSTFMVEVSELRNIMRRATSKSLVIGDELCSGTESASAIGIVGAGIQELCKRKTAFIFATHLHDLTNINAIRTLSRDGCLQVCHLHVYYDNERKALIYDRTLREGQGASIYGIEVCKALDMGDTFLDAAHAFRREYLKVDKTIPTTSRYNSSVFIEKCKLCNSRIASETHHIVEQHIADDETGQYGLGLHKDAAHNLVGLCSECHDKVHNQEIHVKGYVQTSNGVELKVEVENANYDLTNEQQNIEHFVFQLKKEHNMSDAAILKTLNDQFDIKWSRYRLQKTLKMKLHCNASMT